MSVEQYHEVIIFGDDHVDVLRARHVKNHGIFCGQQVELRDMVRFNAGVLRQPARQGRWELRVHPREQTRRFRHVLRGDRGMIHAPRGVEKTRGDVFGLEIGKFFENLLARFAGREQLQDVDDADAHAANTRSPTTLLGADSDALQEVG